MKRRHTLSLAIVLLIVSLALGSCAKSDTTEGYSEDEVVKLTKAAYQEYGKVLEDNKKEISQYTWQAETSDSFKQIKRPIAFEDLNGDQIPELLFFKAEKEGEASAHLYIYTYGEDGIAEMTYAGEGKRFEDNALGAGTIYVVYTGDDGRVYMYKSCDQTTSYSTVIDSYLFNGNEMKLEYSLERTQTVKLDENNRLLGIDVTYTEDGEDVSKSSGEKTLKNAINNMKTALIQSGYDGDDIWDEFSAADSKCMSYEDALKLIDKETK